MPPIIKLQFRHSRAVDFKDILTRCRKFKGYSHDDEYHLVISDTTELLNNWLDFSAIFNRIVKLSGSSGWFMGEPIVPFKSEFFYKLQDSLHYCYQNGYKQTSFRSTFCNGDWGCKQLNSLQKHHSPSRWDMSFHWYRYGKFEGDIWKIDKGQILQILKTEAEIKLLAACPAFSNERIEEFVNQLPDEIEVNESWKVVTRQELTREGFKEVPMYIIPKDIEVIEEEIKGGLQKEIGRISFTQKRVEDMNEDELNDFLDNYNKNNNQ
jgi:hypothetical protein